MKVIDRLVVSGAGNGWVLVHDLKDGSCLYGLGANQHAVRCLSCTEDKLITSGDDGKALVFSFQ
jgi:hypothetical protein